MKKWLSKLNETAWLIFTGFVLLKLVVTWFSTNGQVVGSEFGMAILLNNQLALLGWWGIWTYLRFHRPRPQ